MGFNFDVGGWPNVRGFATSMFVSEAEQMRAFIGFVRQNKLQASIQKKDWAAFANRYNGSKYARFNYDGRLHDQYDLLKAEEAKTAAAAQAKSDAAAKSQNSQTAKPQMVAH